MGSMKGKQEKIDAAFGRLADMIQSGHLLASADTVGFLDTVAAELKDLRAENVKLKGTVSIKLDRVNDLEKALREPWDVDKHGHPPEEGCEHVEYALHDLPPIG